MTKEERAIYNKEYYEKNKDKIKKEHKKIVTCSCGRKVTKNALSRHMDSTLHHGTLIRKLREEGLINHVKKEKKYVN